jgi:flagellar biosynthesis/type III secretory pathway protein FliH
VGREFDLPVIIRTILNAGKMSVNEMKKAFKSLPKGEKTVETTADMLIQEGREQGIEQGIVQGIEKGIVQGIVQGIEKGIEKGIQIGESRARYRSIQDMLQELLQERFDSTDPQLMEKIRSIESAETLKELFRKALRTDSLQEFSRIVDRCLQP